MPLALPGIRCFHVSLYQSPPQMLLEWLSRERSKEHCRSRDMGRALPSAMNDSSDAEASSVTSECSLERSSSSVGWMVMVETVDETASMSGLVGARLLASLTRARFDAVFLCIGGAVPSSAARWARWRRLHQQAKIATATATASAATRPLSTQGLMETVLLRLPSCPSRSAALLAPIATRGDGDGGDGGDGAGASRHCAYQRF